MVEIARSEDREVVDTRSLSALTDAFTRLAVAVENHIANQVALAAPARSAVGVENHVTNPVEQVALAGPVHLDNNGPPDLEEYTPRSSFEHVAKTEDGLDTTAVAAVEDDSTLDARSAAAAAILPDAPTPIDLRIADAVCQGEFSVPPQVAQSLINEYARTGHTTSRPHSAPVVSPVDMTLLVAGEPSAGRWYCVSQGREPGVYSSWEQVSPLVTGVARAVYIRHSTKEEALHAYMGAYQRGGVIRR